MGLPDVQEANTGDMFHQPHQRRLSQSSEDSMLLSCGSSPGRSRGWESSATGSSSSSGSNRCSKHLDTTPSWHHNNNRPCGEQSQCNLYTQCQNSNLREKNLRRSAVNNPDNIRWKVGAKKVTIKRIAGKSFGFKYRDVKGKVNKNFWYTVVIGVPAEGPAAGQISIGDWILSANGQPIQILQQLDVKSIIHANGSDTLTLMIQSPESLIQSPESLSCASCTRQSVNRVIDGRGDQIRESQATKRSGLNKRDLDMLERLEGHSTLNSLMARLPQLRVLISGGEAETVATSILQGATQLRFPVTEVGVSYRAFVSKKNSLFSMYTKNVEQKEWIVNLPDLVENRKSVDEVELEVIALKDSPFTTYCQHILATAHSIFIVQFSGREFLGNRQSVLMSIQQRLNKIRTYASNLVPIYLVMTSVEAFPAEQLAEISNSLNCQFYKGFKNQLQYNAATGYPLFTAVTHRPGGEPQNLPSPFGNLGRQISREDNNDTGQSHVLYSRDNNSLDVCYYAKSTELINSQAYMYGVKELREHLSESAFQQNFIPKSYPYRFMLHRERVKQQRVNKQRVNSLHYEPKAWIMTICGGKQNNQDPDHLLRFLHDNGDIVCADYLKYSSSNSDIILLDREYLITLTKRLTTVPTRSRQQDPSLNDSIRHWDDLQEKSTASSTFLKYLFRNDLESPNILTTLLQMNLIHCLESSPSVTSYIVPFFLPGKKKPGTQAYNHDPRLYNLCVDFHGSIPDGFFLLGLVELIKEAEKTNGIWSIDSATSARLSLGIDCELDIDCDEVQSVINISARCSVSYQHRHLLDLLNSIFNRLEAIKPDLCITIGPPCPLHKCCKAHVIDLAGGRTGKPLWCRNRNVRVDEHPTVNRWLYRVADKQPLRTTWNADRVHVSKRTHISELPPAMVHWICDKLNAPPVGRDWQGLAGVLGYTFSNVTVFANRMQSNYDPCNALLLDWGCSADSTLDLLMTHLACQTLGRMDILTMLHEKWIIVD